MQICSINSMQGDFESAKRPQKSGPDHMTPYTVLLLVIGVSTGP